MKGRNVIITGASAGIGEELAYQYAKLGANVFITARRENVLKRVREICFQRLDFCLVNIPSIVLDDAFNSMQASDLQGPRVRFLAGPKVGQFVVAWRCLVAFNAES